jgi:NAD(P)-dependent dehydrogenase (short-subunit alcohol dehydrogenase family)
MGGFQGSAKFKGLSLYSASKGALAILTECMAEEFKEKNINVNCLALGSVQTEMLAKAFPGYKAQSSPAEMAEFIANFALNAYKQINGKIIPVSASTP